MTTLAEILKRDGIERSRSGAGDEWMTAAQEAIRECAAELLTFTADDVWPRVPDTDEPRAMGAAFQWAKREGVAVPTTSYVESSRPVCHGRPVRVWRPGPEARKGGEDRG